MQWQYKTIFFEYHKDSLFGEKYIDDEDVENVLNEQGTEGWELVTVSMVPEGMIAFCKRPLGTSGSSTTRVVPTTKTEALLRAAKPRSSIQTENKTAPGKVPGNAPAPVSSTDHQDTIGQIKIS